MQRNVRRAPGGSGALASSQRPSGVLGLRWPTIALVVGAILLLLYPLPFLPGGQTYFLTVGFFVLLFAVLGIGWNYIAGWAGSFDFAPQLFFGLGAYTQAILLVNFGVNAWLAIIASIVVTVVICALLTYPIAALRHHYFAIGTIAMWMIAVPIGKTWDYINGSSGMYLPITANRGISDQILNLQFLGVQKQLGYFYVAVALFALCLYVSSRVEYSKFGYYFKALRDDQDGAEAIGIPIRMYKVIARCFTAGWVAAAGAIYTMWAMAVFPEDVLALHWGMYTQMIVIVGGMGRLWGPVLGAVLLIPLTHIMSTYLGAGPFAGRGIDMIIYGVIIMVMAAGRPHGLLSLPWGRWWRGITRTTTPRVPAKDVGKVG
jgi:branched-chain amino acid transport system permease protein